LALPAERLVTHAKYHAKRRAPGLPLGAFYSSCTPPTMAPIVSKRLSAPYRSGPSRDCASGTEWAEAGVTGKTETAMVVRGLIDRDSAGRLVLTPDGRAVLDAVLGNDR
jgi:hypothetical protein